MKEEEKNFLLALVAGFLLGILIASCFLKSGFQNDPMPNLATQSAKYENNGAAIKWGEESPYHIDMNLFHDQNLY